MLKPTERPPPSLQPRFAASITPGPPPVTTAKPASAKSRPVSRAGAVRLAVLVDARRAEDRDGGPVDLEHLLEAAEELGRDHRDVVRQVFVRPLEDAAVVAQARHLDVALDERGAIPSVSSAARPM